jgi:hypothetical protein
MKVKATRAESAYMSRVANMGCILCRLLDIPQTSKTDVHHIRAGQGGAQRAPNFLVLPLCHESCHQGSRGIHGDKSLLRIAKVTELDLLAMVIEEMTA